MRANYRGYKIAQDTVATRFGVLHRAWIDNGEPLTGGLKAYSTAAEAIAAARATVDFWEG